MRRGAFVCSHSSVRPVKTEIMRTIIHPTAIIEPGAEIGEGAQIGPYAYIGSEVRLAARCRVHHHASIVGKTEIGEENEFYPFVSIGQKSQDLKYEGEPTYLKIGACNVFREFTTVNRGTARGSVTVIESHNTFLAYSHVAHDCRIGSYCVFSNAATLGGHVVVEDYVTVGGLAGVHQFCRIGRHAMIGGCSKIVQDVPPYMLVDGNPARVRSINLVGLRRRRFPSATIRELRLAYQILYEEGLNTAQALEAIRNRLRPLSEIVELVEFISKSQRGITR
ncbi:UDP-N-acetylglucosamine acyltransferase [Candidatus Methylacidithermus pantelleriae]|uniref:Acyl-[acyl-carrier-protein]--UDP-N-acetylglucosamine O-acyltransferase n=1 Tax=Candidatus Methylacidithermus pantelleriae TaxID=2744239 RepID=A0A8J2BNR9_9BACT|nr:UDP-N-acetylglucosamine acyltransferase [Candidatus Methylacidithermus pantelleriae]